MGMAALVFASRTGVSLTLIPATARAEDAGALNVWQARLSGSGVDATVVCAEAGWQPAPNLAGFLAELAEHWRGWEGSRSWQSAEVELRISARHDKTNTVLLEVEMEDGAPPRWRCAAELELDPGVFDKLDHMNGRAFPSVGGVRVGPRASDSSCAGTPPRSTRPRARTARHPSRDGRTQPRPPDNRALPGRIPHGTRPRPPRLPERQRRT
jgi:hypothetical protein